MDVSMDISVSVGAAAAGGSRDIFYRVSVEASGAACDLSSDICSITIEQRETEPDQLTLELNDPYKVLGHALQEGMDVEVELGTADDHSVVFRGRIYKVDSDFPEAAVPTLTLRAYDHTMKMGLQKRSRVWSDMKLSDIVTAVASTYFGETEVNVLGDPKFGPKGLRQDNETDLAFLLRLSGEYGCVMYCKAGDASDSFHFVAQYAVMKSEPEITLYYGRSDVEYRLLSFQPTTDVSQIQLPRVLSGIDYETGKPTEVATTEATEVGTTEDPFMDENLTAFRAREPVKAAQLELLLSAAGSVQQVLRDELGKVERQAISTFTTEEELSIKAKNQFSTSLRGMRASGTTPGTRGLTARTVVGIADVGGRFSGTWYLSQVRHVLNQQGFRTEFECRR